MKRSSKILAALTLAVSTFAGCNFNTDRPPTFKESVTELSEMNQSIKLGFESGDLDSAHDPLHEVGHVLESLVNAAKKESFTKDQMTTIESAKENLFDAFGEIDKTFHGGEGATYDEVADTIKTSMNQLMEFAGLEIPADDSDTDESADDDLPDETVEEVDASAPPEDDTSDKN